MMSANGRLSTEAPRVAIATNAECIQNYLYGIIINVEYAILDLQNPAHWPVLTPLISCDRFGVIRAHCHGASLITASVYGDVVGSVSWIRMADTFNTRFANCLYCKIIVLQTFCWIFSGRWTYSTTFFANCQPGSDVLIHMCRLASFDILPLVALCMTNYMSKNY